MPQVTVTFDAGDDEMEVEDADDNAQGYDADALTLSKRKKKSKKSPANKKNGKKRRHQRDSHHLKPWQSMPWASRGEFLDDDMTVADGCA